MTQAQSVDARNSSDHQNNKSVTTKRMKRGLPQLNPKAHGSAVRCDCTNRAGSLHPASGDAGSAAAMEPDVLRSQLWVSTASRGSPLSRSIGRLAMYVNKP